MRQHVSKLCREHQITCHEVKRPNQAYALREADEIGIALIRSAVSYAAAMHEIGHHLGRRQTSRSVLVREREARQWARSNARIWTPSMERSALRALEWYGLRATDLDRKRNRNA
jgi:hypothetical protein